MWQTIFFTRWQKYMDKSYRVIDDMKFSREKSTMTDEKGFVTINNIDKERLVTLPGAKESMNYWFNDVLVNFWMVQ